MRISICSADDYFPLFYQRRVIKVSLEKTLMLCCSLHLLLRLQDLRLYLPQLQHYRTTSSSLSDWIDATRKRQDALQATRITSVQALKDHIITQKVFFLIHLLAVFRVSSHGN